MSEISNLEKAAKAVCEKQKELAGCGCTYENPAECKFCAESVRAALLAIEPDEGMVEAYVVARCNAIKSMPDFDTKDTAQVMASHKAGLRAALRQIAEGE